MSKRLIRFASGAMFLAASGVAVSMVGQRLDRPFLEDKLGPGITLSGAALWVYARFLRRKDGN